MDALTITAWATAALAAVGLVSILTNVYLGWQTKRAAKAAQAAIMLHEREIRLFERQYFDTQKAAFPTFDLRSSNTTPT